jgi:lysophospholipase L1-like esterase
MSNATQEFSRFKQLADADLGDARSPLLLWGPYLWADGVKPRKGDGLNWQRSDFVSDGTHPSDTGRQKVADQLLRFFKTDPFARTWFAKP